MICNRKIYSFHDPNHQIIEECWDVTSVTDGRRKVENRAMFWIESETAIMEKYSCTRILISSCYTSGKKIDFCILFSGSGPTEPRPPALLWSIYLTTLTTLSDHRFIKKIITELTLLSWSSYVDFLFFFLFNLLRSHRMAMELWPSSNLFPSS